MEPVDDLIHTLEVVRDAVWAKDGHKGFEAVTVFLLQFMDLFGHAPDVVSRTFPTLKKLKGAIQTDHIVPHLPSPEFHIYFRGHHRCPGAAGAPP